MIIKNNYFIQQFIFVFIKIEPLLFLTTKKKVKPSIILKWPKLTINR
jgi:hypothetical protein